MIQNVGIESLSPISAALETEVRNQVRTHGIVVWLDLDGHYTGFVRKLEQARARGELPYQVLAYRGSYLRLMLELEGLAGGVDRPLLLVHLPGFNESRVADSPLYELYLSGIRYRKALDTLVTEVAAGRVRSEHLAAFKAEGNLSLERADTWLTSVLEEATHGLAAQLRAMKPSAVLDDLLTGGYLAQRVGLSEDEAILWSRLSAWTGLTPAWREALLPEKAPRAEDVAFVTLSWSLCVEYVDDLKRPPYNPHLQGARTLPRPVIDACRELAAHCRERQPSLYRRTADETEALLADEVEAARAEDLGRIDTFRFEEDKVLKAALVALAEQNWNQAAEWAELRCQEGSFWHRENPSRFSAWQLIADAAVLGKKLQAAGTRLKAAAGLEHALKQYTDRGAAVDRAHRRLEQRRVTLLYPQVPEFETLRACLDQLRQHWRSWADQWARDFNTLCRADGFLPPAHLQQRQLFDDVVRPLTRESGPTAYFVIDAFRYEMGEELLELLKGVQSSLIQLQARLAELPTVTEVGMNVLAPVASGGRLRPSVSDGRISGFSTGEFQVYNPETRKRAMHARVGGNGCPWMSLEEVVNRESSSLKRAVSQAQLVVIHSQEIDLAGEKGVGPAVFDHVMQKLRAAWKLLLDAGVRRFVFTADHGFLLLDPTAAEVLSHGRKVDPSRRHVFSELAADEAGVARVPLSQLGYELPGLQLLFPESTAVFDTGRRSMSFVHGGNSLQERVIPVLTVVHRSAAGGNTLQYAVRATALEDVAGMHCLEARLEVLAQAELGFGGPKEVELGLRVLDALEVQVELVQTRGKARLVGASILATVSEPFEVFFRLTGETDARVEVEIHHPSARVALEASKVPGRFEVTASRVPTKVSPPTKAAGSGANHGTAVHPEPVGAARGVAGGTGVPPSKASLSGGTPKRAWLEQLPEGGIRQLFAHLAEHGVVTASEASHILGNERQVRRFSSQFEQYAALAPFSVRIDVVAGIKRYVREGSES